MPTLKLVEINGTSYAEVVDGKPVIVADDGKENPVDVIHTMKTIGRLNYEAMKNREDREALEAKVKAFEGIDDGEAARKALETVRNLKEGELVTAGKVDEIKAAARKAAEEQVAAAAKASGERLK